MKNIILCIATGLYGLTLSAQLHYPETPKIEVNDTIWGTVYKDNYRWLEDMKDPKVVSWFKQQAQLTVSVMNTISGKVELIAEWQKLDRINPARYILFSEAAGRFSLLMQNPGENIGKVYYRETINSSEKLLFSAVNRTSALRHCCQKVDASMLEHI